MPPKIEVTVLARDVSIFVPRSRERALRDLLATAARRADTEDAQRLAIELEEALNKTTS